MVRSWCNNPAWGGLQEDHPRREIPEIPEIPEFPTNPELSRYPETLEIPEIPEIPIRKGRLSGPETRFLTLSGRFLSQFPEFFKVALRERFASQRKGLNLDFDWHAQYIGAFLHFAKRPTINKNRRKTANGAQTRCAQQNSLF